MSGGHPPFFANAEVMQLDPEEIEIPKRIGFLHMDKAVAFGRLMATSGQRDPIKVMRNKAGKVQPWRLVTGRHRLEGAKLEGLHIWALETAGVGPEDFADIEASENLHRRPLGPIERAMFVHALCQAAQERIAREHGELSHQKLGAKVRWDRVKAGETRAEDALSEEVSDACDKMSQAYGWVESAAEALDLGKRTIFRSLELYRLLIEPFPELAEPLAKHPIVGENASQLRAIAQVKDEGLRRQVIEALLEDDELSADEARVACRIDAPTGAAPVQHQKFYDQITGGWSRLGVAEKRHFVREKLLPLLTPEMKRELRDRLNEELGE